MKEAKLLPRFQKKNLLYVSDIGASSPAGVSDLQPKGVVWWRLGATELELLSSYLGTSRWWLGCDGYKGCAPSNRAGIRADNPISDPFEDMPQWRLGTDTNLRRMPYSVGRYNYGASLMVFHGDGTRKIYIGPIALI
jgi:hypothetical protein